VEVASCRPEDDDTPWFRPHRARAHSRRTTVPEHQRARPGHA
jgi:hypothetical protein